MRVGIFHLSALSLLLLAFAFQGAAGDIWLAWQTDEYSHGLLIPLLAVWLGAHLLTRHRPKASGSWLALPVMAAGLAGLVVGLLAAFQAAAHYGFLLCVLSVLIASVGLGAVRILMPAWGYLWFAVPLPHLFQISLSQELQLISTSIGVGFLQLTGISVYQEGNVIDLGAYRLHVVDACSGLRYLFPLMSFSYLAACMLEAPLWKRMVVFASAIPITIMMNSLRIGIIGITVDLWGPALAEGLVHELEGWVVFAGCALLLLWEIRLLNAHLGKTRLHMEYLNWPHGPYFRSVPKARPPLLAVLLISLSAALTMSGGALEHRQENVPDHTPLALFPTALKEWQGKPENMPAEILDSLKLSDYWLADYRSADAPAPVNLYVAYYDRQRIGTSTHSPSHCIPAGGWRVDESHTVTLSINGGQPLRATRMVIRKNDLVQLVYFWFYERGRNHTQTTYGKWYLLLDAVTLGRTDGSLVRVSTPVMAAETVNDAEQRAERFISLVQPEIERFVPGSSTQTTPKIMDTLP